MTAPALKTTVPWATIADLPSKATDGRWDLDTTAAGEMFDWLQVASDILFNLTRRRWPGATTSIIRPMIVTSGTTVTSEDVSEILLPNPPVVSITEVLIDGAVVAASSYRVDDFRRLVYIPTAGTARTTWPSWQDLDAPITAAGTFQVTYVHGTAPPEGGKRACAELATHLGIQASPKLAGQARSTGGTTSVSRQGVSATVSDPRTLFESGMTGVASVDMWISSVNRGAAQRRGSVTRLGDRRHRRTTAP